MMTSSGPWTNRKSPVLPFLTSLQLLTRWTTPFCCNACLCGLVSAAMSSLGFLHVCRIELLLFYAQAVYHHPHDLRLGFPRVLYWDQLFSFFILPLSAHSSANLKTTIIIYSHKTCLRKITYMQMTLSFIFLFVLGTSLMPNLVGKKIASISSWMTSNFLSLNPSKTEFLLIGLPQQLAKVNQPVLHLPDNTTVTPVTNARNLGILFDSKLSFKQHINFLTKTCLYHCRDLRRIRSSLDFDTARIIATALVHTPS